MGSALRKDFFEKLYFTYNKQEYIHPDPLEFLHEYPLSADREIVGIIASSLAYGRVAQILCSVRSVLCRMGASPGEFLESSDSKNLSEKFSTFKHRFTTSEELVDFLHAVRMVIRQHGSLGRCFLHHYRPGDPDTTGALVSFVQEMKSHMTRRENSLLPSPEKKSACKRLHLFLRWMVREDEVDLGDWEGIAPAKLVIPLDTHMHRIGRILGMTSRKQSDLVTALEMTHAFRKIVPDDPVRYDFSLTRLGIRPDTDMSVLFEQHTSKKNRRGAC